MKQAQPASQPLQRNEPVRAYVIHENEVFFLSFSEYKTMHTGAVCTMNIQMKYEKHFPYTTDPDLATIISQDSGHFMLIIGNGSFDQKKKAARNQYGFLLLEFYDPKKK